MEGSSSPGYSLSFVESSIYFEHAHEPPYKKSNTTLPLTRMIQKVAIWHHYRPERIRRHDLIKRSDYSKGASSNGRTCMG